MTPSSPMTTGGSPRGSENAATSTYTHSTVLDSRCCEIRKHDLHALAHSHAMFLFSWSQGELPAHMCLGGENLSRHVACYQGHLDCARTLLETGKANAHMQGKTTKSTPLHLASLSGNPSLVKLLLQYQVPTMPTLSSSWSPAHASHCHGPCRRVCPAYALTWHSARRNPRSE